MKTYSIFPWVDWLISQGPLTAVFVFFAVDFGVLSIMNVIDIIFNFHGDPNARPRGHWTFWMVVITDTVLLPAVGYSTVRFWQQAAQMGQGIDPTVSAMVDILTAAAGIFVAYKLVSGNTTSGYEDWTFIAGKLNVAGWWHSLCMGFFVQYLSSFLLKGLVTIINTPALWSWYVITVVAMIVIACVAALETTTVGHPEKYPIWRLTAWVFGHPINW